MEQDCTAHIWYRTAGPDDFVRYSTVVNGVGLHGVVSGVVISSTVERRKDVVW